MKQSLWITELTALALFLSTGYAARGVETRASEPQSVTLTIYDTGTALVRERRRANFSKGKNVLAIRDLPETLDPATVSFPAPSGGSGLQILEQQFLDPLSSTAQMFQSYVGRTIRATVAGTTHEGLLISAPSEDGAPLMLRAKSGGRPIYLDAHEIETVTFPEVEAVTLQPTLLCRVEQEKEGVANLRLNYTINDLSWAAFYELILDRDDGYAVFNGRVRIANQSGGDFSSARVRLVSTEKGILAARRGRDRDVRDKKGSTPTVLRHVYGRDVLRYESQEASLSPVSTYELPRALDLDGLDERYVQLHVAEQVPVNRFYVYDGVRFDRFQRNRRNDWNYGTESSSTIEAHLEFENTESAGLGLDLAPGRIRLYERRSDGTLDMVGEDFLDPTKVDAAGHVQIGVARGLRGERERTGYSEVVPLHTYEETFEIRLENNGESEAEIRVVEHLYRWHDFEIVRADTEYEQTGPQTIEFRPKLKPGGRRSVHYTVRYNW